MDLYFKVVMLPIGLEPCQGKKIANIYEAMEGTGSYGSNYQRKNIK